MEEADSYRPYAAVSNVKAVIDRARQRNMPEVIDRDFLTTCQGSRWSGGARDPGSSVLECHR